MRALLVAAALLGLVAMPAHTEPGPIGAWLMKEPLTLWDIGMIRAGDKAEKAGKSVGAHRGSASYGWADYNWDNNEIDLEMSILGFTDTLSHENCNEIRRYFIMSMAPGSGSLNADETSKSLLYDNIGEWFSHRGFKKETRDDDLAEKLARIIFVPS